MELVRTDQSLMKARLLQTLEDGDFFPRRDGLEINLDNLSGMNSTTSSRVAVCETVVEETFEKTFVDSWSLEVGRCYKDATKRNIGLD